MTCILWVVLTFILETGETVTVKVPLAVFPTQPTGQVRQQVVEVEMAAAYPDDSPSTYFCARRPKRV